MYKGSAFLYFLFSARRFFHFLPVCIALARYFSRSRYLFLSLVVVIVVVVFFCFISTALHANTPHTARARGFLPSKLYYYYLYILH